MAPFSRRQFLQTSAVALAAANTGCNFLSKISLSSFGPKREMLLLNSSVTGGDGDIRDILKTPPGVVMAYDVNAEEKFSIGVSFFGHSVTQNPWMPQHALTVERYGKHIGLVDLRERALVKEMECAADNTFVGHCAFSPAEKLIYTTEYNHKTGLGELVKRDPVSLQPVAPASPTYGKEPHDVKILDDNKTLVVSDANRPGNITFIDVASGKMLRQFTYIDQKLHLDHFGIIGGGWMWASERNIDMDRYGHKTDGRVALISPQGEASVLTTNEAQGKSPSGILSHAVDVSSHVMAVTFPEAGEIKAWNMRTREFIGTVELDRAKGILSATSSHKTAHFLVSSGDLNALRRLTINLQTKEMNLTPACKGFGGTGSHMSRVFV